MQTMTHPNKCQANGEKKKKMERERETDRQTDRQTETETENGGWGKAQSACVESTHKVV